MEELKQLKKEIYALSVEYQKKLLSALTDGYELAHEVNNQNYSLVEKKVFALSPKERNKICNSLQYRLIDQNDSHDDSLQTIFKLISNYMSTNKISERQLEKEMDITLTSIYAWRNGKAKPGVDALIKIANYFNVSLDYLVGREKQSAAAQNTPNNATTSPLVARIESLDKLQQAKVMAYIDGLQGVNDPIEAAFRHGQELEKAKQSYAPTGSQKKKFN